MGGMVAPPPPQKKTLIKRYYGGGEGNIVLCWGKLYDTHPSIPAIYFMALSDDITMTIWPR